MSVPQSKRSVAKTYYMMSINALVRHTLTVTSNEKIFKPQYRALTDDIIHSAEKIYIKAFEATNIIVTSNSSYGRRIQLQSDAILETKNLYLLIQMAYEINHLRGKKVVYWISLLEKVKNDLYRWKKSDYERYNRKY